MSATQNTQNSGPSGRVGSNSPAHIQPVPAYSKDNVRADPCLALSTDPALVVRARAHASNSQARG
jgi:hypothetical protein